MGFPHWVNWLETSQRGFTEKDSLALRITKKRPPANGGETHEVPYGNMLAVIDDRAIKGYHPRP